MNYKVISTIKQLRKYKKISQKQISDYIGISERNYRDKENGISPFNQYEMMLLFSYFNMDKEDFFNIFFNDYNNFNLKKIK